MKRRYLVVWRSHEHEWNGRGGGWFSRRDSADRAYWRAVDEGCWDVRLYDNGQVVAMAR